MSGIGDAAVARLGGTPGARTPARERQRTHARIPVAHRAAAFALGLVLPVYLALQGGGYEAVLRNEVGIALWWIAIAGVLAGALPLARPSRAQLAILGALALFAGWTGLSALWSLSPGSSVAELARISCYAAVLAVAILTLREGAVRQLLAGMLCAIAGIGLLALLSRLHPTWFSANETARFLPAAHSRLSWPLNYWNALAAFVAIGVPIAVHFACTARRLLLKSLSAAVIPVLAATVYLTFSRGGWIELAVGLLVLVAFSPRRGWRFAGVAIAAGGSALLIAAIRQRPAIMNGLASSVADRQGGALIVAALLVCVGVACLQCALSLLERHRAGSWGALRVRSRLRAIPAPLLVAGLVALAVLAFLLAGGPGHLAHAWRRFENPNSGLPSGKASTSAHLLSLSGEGRWQYWLACLKALASHPLGIGSGTFQFWWAAHGSISSYVKNAHSLYFETLAETGAPGILLLLAFLVAGFWGALRRWRAAAAGGILGFLSNPEAEQRRSLQACIVAAAATFCVAALYDWVWQIPALPVLLLLLFAAGAAGREEGAADPAAAAHAGADGQRVSRFAGGPLSRLSPRIVCVALGLLGAAAIAWPIVGEVSLRESKDSAAKGALTSALGDARSAAGLQHFAAEPPLQQALVLERQGRLEAAATAARHAIANGRSAWSSWLVLSRIEAERGRAHASLAAWRHARTLDPHDPLFRAS